MPAQRVPCLAAGMSGPETNAMTRTPPLLPPWGKRKDGGGEGNGEGAGRMRRKEKEEDENGVKDEDEEKEEGEEEEEEVYEETEIVVMFSVASLAAVDLFFLFTPISYFLLLGVLIKIYTRCDTFREDRKGGKERKETKRRNFLT